MADGTTQDERRRPHPSPEQLAASFLQFDLAAEIRIVIITLDAGARIPWHHTAGRVSINAVAGRVRVHAEGRTFDMPAGSLLALDRTLPHEVEAIEPSAVLLTIAWGEEALETREALDGRA